ncbi:MAG: chemotaxis protein CheW [Proteobacteria bacterium]|nr:chemotaxis protein CheW [Pseudomonadota bacterium]
MPTPRRPRVIKPRSCPLCSNSALQQLVTFELFGEIFALPILDVREIIRMTTITPVPQAPPFVEGVINLRGQIIPVVDLRKRFGLTSEKAGEDTRIIVVELGNNMVIGLIVDAVREVERIPTDTINPPPALVAGSIGSEYIKGISNHEDKMIVHIDMRKVFSHDEINALEKSS